MKKIRQNLPKWNLGLLYSSPTDPQIEIDITAYEKLCDDFKNKYDTSSKTYLEHDGVLLEALTHYETILAKSASKPFLYFYFLRDIEAGNILAAAEISLLQNRLSKSENVITFFKISLGNISGKKQRQFLSSTLLVKYKVFLERIFCDAEHVLTIPEEKIINLKYLTSYEMWISGNEKMLSMKSVPWKNKNIPLAQAMSMVQQMQNKADRLSLSKSVANILKCVAPFSEAELNAIVTNKKIDDELRGFHEASDSTVLQYRNDPVVVQNLVNSVTDRFDIAHRFYKVKARILKLRSLSYSDRAATIGIVKTKFLFQNSITILKETFQKLNPIFSSYIDTYIANGQIDAPPRIGKRSGAYCAGMYEIPTFILLNHTDDFQSFTTMAHELGHAFHGELSRSQGPLYSDYSTSLAETASTLFESIAREQIFDSLPEKEKVIALHDKINGDISTIFRQIACFNFENQIHKTIRIKGFMSKEDLANLHNEQMARYLGPLFSLKPDDGYFFVHWSHIRRFFYVYSYAYGMLVSKALLRRYHADPSFWKSIEIFLSSGGKASPEEILKEIGIDLYTPGFFQEGLRAIEDDIEKLETLVKNM